MDLFRQVDPNDEKGFGMASIRIDTVGKEIKDEISSSFVLPFVWLPAQAAFRTQLHNFLLAIAARSEWELQAVQGSTLKVQSRKRSSVHVARLGPGDLRMDVADEAAVTPGDDVLSASDFSTL